nr:sensor histidine kinase [Hyphomonas sediminis]
MRSIRLRLLAGGALAVAAALLISWLTLVLLFDSHIRRNTEDDLIRHGRDLASAITFTPSDFSTDAYRPADLRFDRPASGLYWQVSSGESIHRSRSLWDNSLQPPHHVDGTSWHRDTAKGPFGQDVVRVARSIREHDTAPPVTLILAADNANLVDARDEFSREIAIFLTLLWAALSVAAWIQVTIGLLPLRAVQTSISELKSSSANRLKSSRFATEVSPLVNQINELADAREQDLQAARDRAANLAHSLKTPLSALRAMARKVRANGEEDIADGLEHSIQTASEAIDRELARARTAASLERGPTAPAPVLERLIAVLARTERGDRIDFETDCAKDATLPVAEDQLMEMLGPLMENAARYAHTKVKVTAKAGELVVEDDGPGLGSADRALVVLRGQRADERSGGHGLGLAIANDLAEATDGKLELGTSSLGGLKARLVW